MDKDQKENATINIEAGMEKIVLNAVFLNLMTFLYFQCQVR